MKPLGLYMYGETAWELAIYKQLIERIKDMCELHSEHNYSYIPILDLIYEAVGEEE